MAITFGNVAGNWSDGTKWSGGVAPTSTDDVIFNASSADCVVDSGGNCKTLTTTGYTGTLTLTVNINVYGDVVIGSGTNVSYTVGTSGVNNGLATTGVIIYTNGSITSNGVDFGMLTAMANDITVTVLDNLNISRLFFTTRVTLKLDGASSNSGLTHHISYCGLSSGNSAKSFYLGNCSIYVDHTFTSHYSIGDPDLTFDTNTATIYVESTALLGDVVELSFGGLTKQHNMNGTSLHILTRSGSQYVNFGISTWDGAILNNLTIDAPNNINNFSQNIALTSLTATGSSGNLISIEGTGGSISIASGTVSCDYLSLTNCVATGGATFYAGNHSVDNGGNTGWIFHKPYSHIKCKSTDPDKLSFYVDETEIGEFNAS